MNELQLFNFHNQEVRTLMIDNKPYFVGNDIATVLGYKRPSDTVRKKIKDKNKGVAKMETPGGTQEVTIINEAGLYTLILSSKLPQAEEFQDWVTSEVLPTIRKHGAYATPQTLKEMLDKPSAMIEILKRLEQEQEEKAKIENKLNEEKENRLIAEQQVKELKPKADYLDQILKSKNLMTITQIAKDYGMSAVKFNKLLHELKVQYKQGSTWLLYSKHQSKGWTHSEPIEFTKTDGTKEFKLQTKWTQKGRLGLYELLKKKDILPMIERV